MAFRLAGMGFGSFTSQLKEAANAAREAYDALDNLQTMTIFMDKSTADYNYQKAQYERIIRDRKSSRQQVKEAENGLKRIREAYQKEQNALANQAMTVYNTQIRQAFANQGLGEGAYNRYKKYLNDLQGYNKAIERYQQLQKEIKNDTHYTTMQSTAGAYSVTTYGARAQTIQRSEEYNALRVIAEMSDEKLKEANGHYINARNIQTAVVRDEIQQMQMLDRVHTRINKNNKVPTTPPGAKDPTRTPFEEYREQLRQYQTERDNLLFSMDTGRLEGQEYTIAAKRVEELNKLIRDYEATIKRIEDYDPFAVPVTEETTEVLSPLEKMYQQLLQEAQGARLEAQGAVNAWKDMLAMIPKNKATGDIARELTPEEERAKKLAEDLTDKYNQALELLKMTEMSFLNRAANDEIIDEFFGSIPFLEEKIKRLKLVAEAAISIDNVQLYNETQEKIKALEALLKEKKIKFGIDVDFNMPSLMKEYSDSILAIANDVNSLGNSLGDLFDSEAVKDFFNAFGRGLSILNSTVSLLENINKLTEIMNTLKEANAAATAQQTAATAADATASAGNASAKASEAVAGATAAGASIPFPYNLIAIAAGIAAVLGALTLMGSFADGGIVRGSTTVGDHGLARVNAGEMILNPREQTRLWHMVNGQGVNYGSVSGDVSFKIRGSDLVGVLNNYESKNRRVQ